VPTRIYEQRMSWFDLVMRYGIAVIATVAVVCLIIMFPRK